MYSKKSEFLAELIGSMFLILLGCGVVAAVVICNNGAPVNIHLAWGLAVTFGIYVSGKISGAHLNPAVTLALAVTKRFPWIEVDSEFVNTAGVFCTFPAVPGFLSGLVDQIVGTFILVFLILAVGDANNTPAGSNLGPIIVGLIVVAIGLSFGAMHGYAINPARDLGPRLFAVVAGFKNNGLTDGTNVWIVPIIGPIIGGILAGIIYDLTLGKILSSNK